MARALFSAGHIVGDSNGTLLVGLPNETHRSRCESHRGDVEAAIAKHFGVGIKLTLVVDTSSPSEGGQGSSSSSRNNNTDPTDTGSPRPAEPRALPKDEEVDVNDLIDAPPESVVSPIDQLTQAFPGSKLIDEPR
jgi:DNA polymerase-3 subunit gamma/tau